MIYLGGTYLVPKICALRIIIRSTKMDFYFVNQLVQSENV